MSAARGRRRCVNAGCDEKSVGLDLVQATNRNTTVEASVTRAALACFDAPPRMPQASPSLKRKIPELLDKCAADRRIYELVPQSGGDRPGASPERSAVEWRCSQR